MKIWTPSITPSAEKKEDVRKKMKHVMLMTMMFAGTGADIAIVCKAFQVVEKEQDVCFCIDMCEGTWDRCDRVGAAESSKDRCRSSC